MRKLSLCLFLLFFCGCIADNKSKLDPVNPQTTVVNVPAPQVQKVDTGELEARLSNQIQTSTNNMTSSLSGLVSTSVGKLGDNLTGMSNHFRSVLEANIKSLADINAKAEINAQATLKGIETFNSTISTKFDSVVKLESQIEKLTAELKAMGSAQVGIAKDMSSIQQDIKNTAGRDINYLPKEAVEIMMERERTFTYILGGILSLASLAIGWIGRNARERERLRTQSEREDRQSAERMLRFALAKLSENQAHAVLQPLKEEPPVVTPGALFHSTTTTKTSGPVPQQGLP